MKDSASPPRPTSGHHFSDLLVCPQRAWLHYYGNPKAQVKDPAYLRALQQEGIRHEEAIYEKLFPNALRIPQKGSAQERHRLTVEAMHAGIPVILQGFIHTDDGVGVLDVLELVSSDPSGSNLYRVGEIKRSARLLTAHVFQASWYTELVGRVQGQKINEACFFLKDGERMIVDLSTLATEYEKAKAELSALRENKSSPGPHLVTMCASCHWRGLCMPELIDSQHLSLIPGISRQQAATLKELGISSWTGIKTAPDDVLESIGLGNYEIDQVRRAVENLQHGTPPLRQALRPDIFQNVQIVVLEFSKLAAQRRAGQQPVPSAIHYEMDGGLIGRIGISSAGDVSTVDLTPILHGNRLGFYGLTDLSGFLRLAREAGFPKIKHLDILSVVEAVVHGPVPGLELESLYSYIVNKPLKRLSGPARVTAIREVVNWMAQSV